MRKSLFEFLSQVKEVKEWGLSLIEARQPLSEQPTASTEKHFVEIYRRGESGETVIGFLSQEGEEFVFRYDPKYAGSPISGFSRKNEEYRSGKLWPFFAVRVPPFSRQDMKEEMKKLSLSEGQIIEILGLITKVSISNPYEFRLKGPLAP